MFSLSDMMLVEGTGRRKCLSKPLVMWWCVGEKEAFYSTMIRSQSFSEAVPCTV